MSLTLPPELASPMQALVNKNLLKYAAGNAMFCPQCQICMDWKRTTIITVDPGPRERVVVGCSPCMDKALRGAKPKLEAAGLSYEVVDGREYSKRGKK